MEEPELRVGGWVQQKKRGKIRRLFSFLLIVIVGLLVGGPMFVDYNAVEVQSSSCLLYTSPSPRDLSTSRMPSSA